MSLVSPGRKQNIFLIKFKAMETVFALFETDVHGTKKSRILLGIFTSRILAEIQADKHRCNSTLSNVLIIPIQVNIFGEV